MINVEYDSHYFFLDEPAGKVQITFLKHSSGGYWDIRKKSKPEIIDARYVFMGRETAMRIFIKSMPTGQGFEIKCFRMVTCLVN